METKTMPKVVVNELGYMTFVLGRENDDNPYLTTKEEAEIAAFRVNNHEDLIKHNETLLSVNENLKARINRILNVLALNYAQMLAINGPDAKCVVDSRFCMNHAVMEKAKRLLDETDVRL